MCLKVGQLSEMTAYGHGDWSERGVVVRGDSLLRHRLFRCLFCGGLLRRRLFLRDLLRRRLLRHRLLGRRLLSSLLRLAEHTSELQSLMRISSAVFCLTTKK